MIYLPKDADIEWVTTCLITHGASDVKVDIDGREIKSIQFRFPGGRECRLEYRGHVAKPCLIIGRGRV